MFKMKFVLSNADSTHVAPNYEAIYNFISPALVTIPYKLDNTASQELFVFPGSTMMFGGFNLVFIVSKPTGDPVFDTTRVRLAGSFNIKAHN